MKAGWMWPTFNCPTWGLSQTLQGTVHITNTLQICGKTIHKIKTHLNPLCSLTFRALASPTSSSRRSTYPWRQSQGSSSATPLLSRSWDPQHPENRPSCPAKLRRKFCWQALSACSPTYRPGRECRISRRDHGRPQHFVWALTRCAQRR